MPEYRSGKAGPVLGPTRLDQIRDERCQRRRTALECHAGAHRMHQRVERFEPVRTVPKRANAPDHPS